MYGLIFRIVTPTKFIYSNEIDQIDYSNPECLWVRRNRRRGWEAYGYNWRIDRGIEFANPKCVYMHEYDTFEDGAVIIWGKEELQWMVKLGFSDDTVPLSLYLVNPFSNSAGVVSGMVPYGKEVNIQ